MNRRESAIDEMERFFERMSRQFDEAARTWGSDGVTDRGGRDAMPVDILDHDAEFVAAVDVPGVDREDVSVRVTDRTLRIRAERETVLGESEDAEDAEDVADVEDRRYVRRERRHESVERSIDFPEAVDPEGVTARMSDGVLTVRLPKREVVEARAVDVEAE